MRFHYKTVMEADYRLENKVKSNQNIYRADESGGGSRRKIRWALDT